MDMRADTPRTPTLKVPDEISIGESELVVKTSEPDCIVCVWKDSDVYAIATSDDDGRAVVEIAPQSPGNLSVTISGASLNAVSATTVVSK